MGSAKLPTVCAHMCPSFASDFNCCGLVKVSERRPVVVVAVGAIRCGIVWLNVLHTQTPNMNDKLDTVQNNDI